MDKGYKTVGEVLDAAMLQSQSYKETIYPINPEPFAMLLAVNTLFTKTKGDSKEPERDCNSNETEGDSNETKGDLKEPERHEDEKAPEPELKKQKV